MSQLLDSLNQAERHRAAANQAPSDAQMLEEVQAWLAREAQEAAALDSARVRLEREKNMLDAARRRIEAESNARKLAAERAKIEAETEHVLRERIEVTRQAYEEQKARELAESEAANLATIRARAEQTLAAQEEARAEAEKAAELAAIRRAQEEALALQQTRRREAAAAAAQQSRSARVNAELRADEIARERQALEGETGGAHTETAGDAPGIFSHRGGAGQRLLGALSVAVMALLCGILLGAWLNKGPGSTLIPPTPTVQASGSIEPQLKMDDTLRPPLTARPRLAQP